MHKKNRILATDLDGTLFMPMSKGIGSGIGSLKKKLADNPAVCLVFASGRSLKLIEEAIEQYDLPKPDMTVGDVGTSIYVHNGESWELDAGWRELMSDGWQGHPREEIAGILNGIDELQQQETDRLTEFKQSYYLDIKTSWPSLEKNIKALLLDHGIRSELVYSTQPLEGRAFLDILPLNAAKDEAVHYVMKKLGLDLDDVLYAGDSGNDLLPLTRGFNAVVVQNAPADLKEKVREVAQKKGISQKIFFATKPCAQGVVEAIDHFDFF
jgi:sucrose-6F-phosphate phosphohydrolase